MNSPFLPQEIFDASIDNLWADTDSLKNCALVSSAWLSSTRSHLFYCIHLDPPTVTWDDQIGLIKQEGSPCEKFFTILSSPASNLGKINRYVREIYLSEGMYAREWLANEPTLPSLLRSLHNLRRFEISHSPCIEIPWHRLPETLKTAIQDHVLCLPSLTELKLGSLILDNLSVINHLLLSCRQLKILEVERICFADEGLAHLERGGVDEVVDERQPSLEVLVVGHATSMTLVAFWLRPSSCINVETIRKLTLSISSKTFADFARLLHASLSVEQLELSLMNCIDLEEYWKLPPKHQFNLSLVPYLQTLKVHIGILRKVEGALPWLKVLLDSGSSFSRPNAITKICITYALHVPTSDNVSSLMTIFDEWTDIDALLCGTSTEDEPGQNVSHAYERLKEVKLVFMLQNRIGFEVAPEFLKQLVLDSPGLEKRGIFSVNAFDKMG